MLVIYHGPPCADGFTSAWIAWLKYGDSAQYIPAQYGDEPPDVTGEDVLIVDFSYPRATLLKMAEKARSIRVFDHHRTAQADLEGLDFCVFDMARSGAGITWDELHGGPRPQLVDYVEDRDLWRWGLVASREINAYIKLRPQTFGDWSELRREMEVHPVAHLGAGALKATERYVETQIPLARWLDLGGYEVPCINTTFAVSELVGALCEGLIEGQERTETIPFAAGWFQLEDGRFKYSLRSRGDFDVSRVAQLYGGGGHPGAAGFTVGRLLDDPLARWCVYCPAADLAHAVPSRPVAEKWADDLTRELQDSELRCIVSARTSFDPIVGTSLPAELPADLAGQIRRRAASLKAEARR